MGRIFKRKQFSDYLGENRAILDIYTNYYLDPSPTPSPTPSVTPTITVTPSITPTISVTPSSTCPTTTQYLKFVAVNANPPTAELSIWSDSAFTIPTDALCNYRINGEVLSNLGNASFIQQFIFQGNHSLLYNFPAWTFPGEYTVSTRIVGSQVISGCTCPVILVTGSTTTPTPTPTPTLTPTLTTTPTLTPTPTTPCFCEENEIVVTSGSITEWYYTNCQGEVIGGTPIVAPASVTVCACSGSVDVVAWSGSFSINYGAQCVTPTPTPTATFTPTPSTTPIPPLNIGQGFDNTARVIYIDGNDVYVFGDFIVYNEIYAAGGIKMDLDGNVDTTWTAEFSNNSVSSVVGVQPDETGDYLYVFGAFLRRIRKIDKATGTDVWAGLSGTNPNGNINGVYVDPITGDLTIAGNFTSLYGSTRTRIAKMDKDRNLSATSYTGTGFNNQVTQVFTTQANTIMMTGNFTTFNGGTQNRLIEIDPSTETKTSFWGTGANNTTPWYITQDTTTGDLYLIGNGGTISGITVEKIAKFTNTGTNITYPTSSPLDFGGIAAVGMFLDETNGWVYVGNQQATSGISRFSMADGTRDYTFEASLNVLPANTYTSVFSPMTKDQNNLLWVVGSFTFVNGDQIQRIMRLLQNGSLNTIN